MTIDVRNIHGEGNIADLLDEDTLTKLGQELLDDIQDDDTSRQGWLEHMDHWLTLAAQVMEPKNTPWPNAANVKFPLLSTAAIQFHARSFPALFGNRTIVKGKIVGVDNTGEKRARSRRVGQFMSTQLLDLMPQWLDDQDRLLLLLPIAGMAWKKTYMSPTRGKVSELIHPRDVIVNYHARSLETARVTHTMALTENEIVEGVRSGMYRNVDLNNSAIEEEQGVRDDVLGFTPSGDQDDVVTTYSIYESHCFLDLDEDGYAEPYIVTLASDSGEILSIVPRWISDKVLVNDEDEITKIIPAQYFTLYKFIPDPESDIYAYGFGVLLGPINEATNTLINQLIDGGTLSNLQSGFIGRGARLKGEAGRFKPGEWKHVQATGDDLRKNIFPLPVREPSNVLFQLLGLLIDAGKGLSSVQDIFTGKSPGQNQPYATTRAVLEQGMQVFNGIYKRVYRAMSEELRKLYVLNTLYPEPQLYQEVMDDQQADWSVDFNPNENYEVIPSAEMDMIAETQKILMAQSLFEKMQMGAPINIQFATKIALQADGFTEDEIAEAMNVPPPQDTEQQLARDQFEHQKQMDYIDRELDTARIEANVAKDDAAAEKMLTEAAILEEQLDFEMEKETLQHFERAADRAQQLTASASGKLGEPNGSNDQSGSPTSQG